MLLKSEFAGWEPVVDIARVVKGDEVGDASWGDECGMIIPYPQPIAVRRDLFLEVRESGSCTWAEKSTRQTVSEVREGGKQT